MNPVHIFSCCFLPGSSSRPPGLSFLPDALPRERPSVSCPWPCCFSSSTAHLAPPTGSRSLRVVPSPWPPSRPPTSPPPSPPTELPPCPRIPISGTVPQPPSHQAGPSGTTTSENPQSCPSLTAPSPSALSHRPHPHPHRHSLSLLPCSSLILSYLVHGPDLWSQASCQSPMWPQRGLAPPSHLPPLTALPWLPSTHREKPLPSRLGPAWSGLH